MSENTFWICLWMVVAVTFVAAITAITVGSRYRNEMYYKAQTECVSSGGSWVPSSSGTMCLRK